MESENAGASGCGIVAIDFNADLGAVEAIAAAQRFSSAEMTLWDVQMRVMKNLMVDKHMRMIMARIVREYCEPA